MAIVTCPECGKEEASDSAKTCPNCGYDIKSYYEPGFKSISGERRGVSNCAFYDVWLFPGIV